MWIEKEVARPLAGIILCVMFLCVTWLWWVIAEICAAAADFFREYQRKRGAKGRKNGWFLPGKMKY